MTKYSVILNKSCNMICAIDLVLYDKVYYLSVIPNTWHIDKETHKMQVYYI